MDDASDYVLIYMSQGLWKMRHEVEGLLSVCEDIGTVTKGTLDYYHT